MTLRNLFSFAICCVMLASCSPTLSPFTQRMYDKYNWSEEELKGIQFYLSHDIRLYRDIGKAESSISGGKIKVENGREIEEVIFKKGTPGVYYFSPKSQRLGISFDNGGGEKFLMFGPNEKLSGQYVLLAKDWERQVGTVTYDGQLFKTDARSALASLMVDIKKINSSSYSTTVAKGRKVEN